MMLVVRAYAAEAFFVGAALFAKAARIVSGRPTACLSVAHKRGERVIYLDQRIPAITERLRLESATCFDMPKVVKVRGLEVTLDRPLQRDFPKGTLAKVLI